MASVAGLLTQGLHRIGDILRLVDICIAERRSPGEVLVHIFENRRKLYDGFYAWIPVMLVDFFGQLFALEVGMRLHPAVCLDDLGWIRRSSQNLRHQSIRV